MFASSQLLGETKGLFVNNDVSNRSSITPRFPDQLSISFLFPSCSKSQKNQECSRFLLGDRYSSDKTQVQNRITVIASYSEWNRSINMIINFLSGLTSGNLDGQTNVGAVISTLCVLYSAQPLLLLPPVSCPRLVNCHFPFELKMVNCCWALALSQETERCDSGSLCCVHCQLGPSSTVSRGSVGSCAVCQFPSHV